MGYGALVWAGARNMMEPSAHCSGPLVQGTDQVSMHRVSSASNGLTDMRDGHLLQGGGKARPGRFLLCRAGRAGVVVMSTGVLVCMGG